MGWSVLLPPLATQYDPSSADDCVAGREQCVAKTIRQLTAQTNSLAVSCDHRAVFALAYLRTTEGYHAAAQEPGFFSDVPFMNHYDTVFAVLYFQAYDAWARGDLARVPPAWRVAFRAAADRSVSGVGDLLLGMNGHVNRDLPFTLAAIGLVKPGGSSRKPDHDKVNEFLNRIVQPLLAEEAARFDPQMDDANTPYGISYTALLQLLISWRERAWRNAEQLVAAPDEASRQAVAQRIEAQAEAEAQSIVAAQRYAPPLTSTAARDAYCAQHGTGG